MLRDDGPGVKANAWHPCDHYEELLPEVQKVLRGGPSEAEVRAVVSAAEPLWEALAKHGWVDGWGGGEFSSVFPQVVMVIRFLSNSSYCGCGWTGWRADCPDPLHAVSTGWRDFSQAHGKLFDRLDPELVRLKDALELGLLTQAEYDERRRAAWDSV